MKVRGLLQGLGMGACALAMALGLGACGQKAGDTAAPAAAEGGEEKVLNIYNWPDYITDGALDRARMRTLVFSDPTAKQRLEAIVHPFVGREIAHAAAQAHRAGHALIVFDIPLLTESPRWARQLDAVLVVDCREETQIQRVQMRSGLTADAVRAIMATQSPRATRRAAADLVVYNDGLALSDLQTKAREIAVFFGL